MIKVTDDILFEPCQPGLIGCSGHLATISRSFTGSTQWPPHEYVEVTTPDDDFIELDVAENSGSAPTLIIIHGLEGSSKRYYVAELAMSGYSNGWNIVAMNFRSCGTRINRQPRFYHSGETSDLHLILQWIVDRFPDSSLFGAGFSLGGNVLLKSLGELQSGHPLTAATAVSVPYDLEYSSYVLSKGLNRIYEIKFVKELKAKLNKKRQEQFPDLPHVSGTHLYDFDNAVTAPLHGFENALDYYRNCSCQNYLQHISRPVLTIHSKKDPLCPYDIVPQKIFENNPLLFSLFTEYGGHVGFCSSPKGWVNRQILSFFNRYLA